VLLAYGKKIKFFEVPVPSPLIAFETLNVELGLMVSASHNPYIYNGIKIFQRGGRELTTQQNTALEKIANKVKLSKIQTKNFDVAVKEKQVQLTKNLTPYVNSILKNVDTKLIKNSGLTIYYNAMQGSSFLPAKQIFDKLGLSVNYMNTDVNPNFKFGLPAPYKDNIHDQETLAKKTSLKTLALPLMAMATVSVLLMKMASFMTAIIFLLWSMTTFCQVGRNAIL
jgi:phosphomannomutase